jgi:hypothetical protein
VLWKEDATAAAATNATATTCHRGREMSERGRDYLEPRRIL